MLVLIKVAADKNDGGGEQDDHRLADSSRKGHRGLKRPHRVFISPIPLECGPLNTQLLGGCEEGASDGWRRIAGEGGENPGRS